MNSGSNGTILFTDLDGTLLNSERQVSRKNLKTLEKLGSTGTTRVIATGRSWYSYRQVITDDFPVDYVIFSSGAGIFETGTQKLIYQQNLEHQDIQTITGKLDLWQVDYMVHHPVPENHRFVYKNHSANNPDFSRRIDIYRRFASEFNQETAFPTRSAQVITVLDSDVARFYDIAKEMEGYQVTRTTSPLDHSSIWLEIYPRNVHKGSAASWLCSRLNIRRDSTVGIGNDFNDIDLLEFTEKSYILGNAPTDLRHTYQPCPTHDENGFSYAVTRAFR